MKKLRALSLLLCLVMLLALLPTAVFAADMGEYTLDLSAGNVTISGTSFEYLMQFFGIAKEKGFISVTTKSVSGGILASIDLDKDGTDDIQIKMAKATDKKGVFRAASGASVTGNQTLKLGAVASSYSSAKYYSTINLKMPAATVETLSIVEVTNVNVDLAPDTRPDFTAKVTGESADKVEVADEAWIDMEENFAISTAVESKFVLIADHYYEYSLTLTAKSGYQFDDTTTVSINGDAALLASMSTYQILDGGATLEIWGIVPDVLIPKLPEPAVLDLSAGTVSPTTSESYAIANHLEGLAAEGIIDIYSTSSYTEYDLDKNGTYDVRRTDDSSQKRATFKLKDDCSMLYNQSTTLKDDTCLDLETAGYLPCAKSLDIVFLKDEKPFTLDLTGDPVVLTGDDAVALASFFYRLGDGSVIAVTDEGDTLKVDWDCDGHDDILVEGLYDPAFTCSYLADGGLEGESAMVFPDSYCALANGAAFPYFTAVTVRFPGAKATVTFDAGEGDGTMEAGAVEKGAKYALPECGFTAPEGKEFEKWDKGAPGDEILVTEDMTVTALWKDKEEEPDPEPLRVMPFTDVIEGKDWFYSDVKIAYESYLIDGYTDTTYEPKKNLTYAQAVKLAACMHERYTTSKVTLENGSPWYQPYVDYAKANGIISDEYDAWTKDDWNANATRAGYIKIFANALPAEAFTAKNTVADDAIPDVKMDHPQAAEIYKLYRAGILEGSSGFKCKPDDNITRAEVAAILTRMMNPAERKEFTLT